MVTYTVGPFTVDPQMLAVRSGSEQLPLGRKVAATLLVLAQHSGEVVESVALIQRIWPEGYVNPANLWQNIYVLRRAFEAHGLHNAIEHIPRRGYRLCVPVTVTAPLTVRPESRPHYALAVLMAVLVLLISVSSVPKPSVVVNLSRPALSEPGSRAYAIGHYYLDQRTRFGVRRSIDFFTRTIDSDPEDARGYAAMADANVLVGDYCYGTHRPRVYFARAKAYVATALRLQPNAPEALAAQAFINLHEQRLVAASAELDRVIAAAPDYADAHEWRGIAYSLAGNEDAALRELKTAQQLDPLSAATASWLAHVANRLHRVSERQLARVPGLKNHPTWASIEALQ